jgi:hypothetical protein
MSLSFPLQAEKMLAYAGGSLSSLEALDRMLHEIGSAATAVEMCMPGNESSTGALRRLMSRRTYKRGDRLLHQGELNFILSAFCLKKMR